MSALSQKRTSPSGDLGRDPPQTVHVAFISLKRLFSFGKGQTWSRVMAKKKKKNAKSKT
jgi:hypothetical protein